ncbi:MAG: CHAD domain-containing protein [Caulobacteraceae bacterium]|nr:CHAD domain-containing protein [Caulobacteraceae bacterium]
METELKFEVDPAAADQLIEELALASQGEEVMLKSVYYDTAGADLRGQGIALRVRDDGRRRIQTVKQNTARAFERGEWEHEIEGVGPDLAAAEGSPLAKALGAMTGTDLKPAFEVTVERARRDMAVGDGVVEVALDRGAVSADGYGSPICELELELKSGGPGLLFDLARSIAERTPLDLSFVTKAERGYALMDGVLLSPVKATRPTLAAKASAEEAFRVIAHSALAQITANARVLRVARRPEAVHQLRVGARRLRSAIALFGEMLADARRESLKIELKWISGELDEARNIDVFLSETFRPGAARRRNAPGMGALGASLLTAQTRAYDRVEAALRSRRFGQLTLETAAWIETGLWASDPDPVRAALRERPAVAFAADILAQRHRKVIRRGRKLERLAPEDRHHLRIQAKKLRYAGDFFAALYAGKAARRHAALTKALAAFQDGLGALNDIVVGAGIAARLVGADPAGGTGVRRKGDLAQAFAAGQVWADREAGAAQTLEDSLAAYRRLAKAKPYW